MTKRQLQLIKLLSIVACELKEVHKKEEMLLQEQTKLTDELFRTIKEPSKTKKKVK